MDWHPSSWRARPAAQAVAYPDRAALGRVGAILAGSSPLVSAAGAARLRDAMAKVAAGEALLLQGGDCAESFGATRAGAVLPTLRLLGRLADTLGAASGRAVVTVARMAGQFAKPRSNPVETLGPITLPAWRGDIVNGQAFTPRARRADPTRMLTAYREAAATLALMREAPGPVFASHEALLLDYEEALTREEDGRHWCLSAHMVWIGARTAQPGGAHVEYARGIANAIALKVGPGLDPDTLLRLAARLDPDNEPGRLTLIARMGAERLDAELPPLVRAARAAGLAAPWVCDPMHGNTRREGAVKRRTLAAMTEEVRNFRLLLAAEGIAPAGLHLELTGADVIECDGHGISGAYSPLCDPRLNGDQAKLIVAAFAAAPAGTEAARDAA